MWKKLKETYSKFSQFAIERAIWIKAGRPLRNTERMKEIYTICQSNQCGHFQVTKCGLCGCRLHPTDLTLPNKIAWATTECPHENQYWGPEEGYEKVEPTEEEIAAAQKDEEIDKRRYEPKGGGCGCGKN